MTLTTIGVSMNETVPAWAFNAKATAPTADKKHFMRFALNSVRSFGLLHLFVVRPVGDHVLDFEHNLGLLFGFAEREQQIVVGIPLWNIREAFEQGSPRIQDKNIASADVEKNGLRRGNPELDSMLGFRLNAKPGAAGGCQVGEIGDRGFTRFDLVKRPAVGASRKAKCDHGEQR